MNADRLLALYEKVAEAPDAVSRLRRFVLDLAVRGKLVPQDAGDEPASQLLATIVSERKERVERREIKRGASLEPVEEAPFVAPAGWEWVPLGDTGNIFSGNSINATTREQLEKTDVGLPFIATKDVGYGLDVIDYDNGLLVPVSDGRFKTARAKSVLICAEGGSAGRKIGLSDREICFGNKLLANETWSVIVPDFVRFVYMSDFFFGEFAARMTGVIGGISIKNFLQLPFPLPPLAEQRRIVAKVEELMALLDRLEAARTAREATRDRLTPASLARLTAADADAADFPANARFALEALPALTTRPDQIKTLRQTILNLAVRGKLVEQDPADEPATELLEAIAETRKQLMSSKELKKSQPAKNPISFRDEYALPKGWAVANCDEMFFVTKLAGFEYTKYFNLQDEGEVPVIRAQNVRPMDISDENLKFISEAVSDALPRSSLTKDCLLITFIGAGIGDVALFQPKRKWHLAPNVAKAEPFQGGEQLYNLRFLALFFNSPLGRREIFKHVKTTAQPSLSMGTIRDIDILVPPLAEQHRIVAKVDALMTLCDRLEAALTEADTTRTRLLEALLHEALAPATDTLDAAE